MGDSLAGSRGGGRADERDSLVADGERDGPRRGYRPRRSSRRGRCLPEPATRTGAALTAVASLALVGLPGTALARVQAPQPPGPSLTAATAPGDGARGRQAPPRQAQAPVHLPAGLQAAIDRTLSAEPATSPSGLSLTWGSAGAVSFRPGKAGQGFTLRPVSFGAARLEAFSPGSFVFGQKDVTEALGHGASAWYKASAKGFEQGFTISRPPAGKAGALSIVLSYSGGLHPSSPGPRGFDISGRSGPEMTYGGLRATDATGKALPARLVLGHGTVRITVSDAGAAYPVTVDPFVAPSSAPTATFTGTGTEQLGSSVALSADGQVALVGAPFTSSGNGAAYLYTEASGTWPSAPTASFTGTGGENLGWSVALSADGQTALVGAPFASSNNGAAYLYAEPASGWPATPSPTANFTGTGGEQLGYSVALSADGQTALVGAFAASSGNGAAYLYTEASGTWPTTPTASFTGTGGEQLGYSVALSADGQAALVGAPFASSSNGAAYLYTEASGTWPTTPAASFTGTGSENLGWSVALSADGQAALVGAPTASSGNGAAYLYEATGVVSAVVSGSQTYGSSLPSFTYTDDAPSSLAVTGTPACTEVETATAISASLGAGSYSLDGVSCSGLSLTGPGSGGYAISYGGAFAVAPAPLTITASSTTMAEGGPVPAITPSYSGFVLGQGPSYLTTAPTCSTTARSSSAPGSYPATCSGAVDPNYAITYVAGTVTVEATTTTTAPTTTTTTAPTTTTPTTTTTAPTTTTTATVPPPLVVVTTPTTTTTTMTTAPAPPPEFPGAAKSYPNGAIVSFGGAYYVFAGGRAFSVPKAALGALGKVDHAKVVTAPPGATPPTGAPPRPGTLVTAYSVDHDPTIYVEGTDTKLHGFASLHQFLSAGFDPALVVTVAGLGNAPVSATTAGAAHITALSTRSDGALAISGHTWYVFAGGRAFGISTPAGLAKLRGTDTAKPLVGEVTPAEESAVPADGVLLSVHSLGVFVAYRGELFGFKAMAQLFADGYGGTAAVPVPGTGALPVVFPYSGS